MPAVSKAQQKYLFWAEKHGKAPKGIGKEFAVKGSKYKKLPNRVSKKNKKHKKS